MALDISIDLYATLNLQIHLGNHILVKNLVSIRISIPFELFYLGSKTSPDATQCIYSIENPSPYMVSS